MLRPYSQKQRCFPRRHKSDPMMKQNLVQSKSLSRGVGNNFHLMLGHGFVSFIIDSFDFMTLFQLSNYSPKIDDRSGRKACPERSRRIDPLTDGFAVANRFFRRLQRRFSQQNLRNGICHAFESLVTM